MKEQLQIVKVGGAVVENPSLLDAFLTRFASLQGHTVLVHGGGRSATTMAEKLGIPQQMIDGRRITDKATLEVVTMVYGGLVNKNIVAGLQTKGINALGLTGADLGCMIADKRPLKDGVDYGYVGDVKSINADALAFLLNKGITPVLTPLTFDGKGSLLNTNADTVASEVAKALAAEYEVTLTYCFEKKGVLLNPDDDDSVIAEINAAAYAQLKEDGVVAGGMIPKLDNAFASIRAGVSCVQITSAETLGENAGTKIR